MTQNILTKEKKFENIFIAAAKQLWPGLENSTGKYRITIELNLSQGGVGESFIETHTKERLK